MRSTKSVAHSTPDPSGFSKKDRLLYEWLEGHYDRFNQPVFVVDDSIAVPHDYAKPQDIEIAAFFTAIMAWGQRKTIVNKARELMRLMDGKPYDFIRNHQETDRKRFTHFKHRTLQPEDVLFLVDVLQRYYQKHDTLEHAFANHMQPGDQDVYHALAGFHQMVFDHPWALERTRKHIATPLRKSSCKRLNMLLRWMVRQDDRGVDFGMWKSISPAQLMIPLDVHVGNVARKLNLLQRKADDWQAAKELTDKLKQFDPKDPAKYDFALFGAGVNRVDH